MTFTSRVAKHLLVIKAAKEFKKEIEQVGLDDLKIVADAGRSIVTIYLNACSPQKKASLRRDLGVLLQMGVTPDMLLAEISRQMPELAPIMVGREDYKKTEIHNLEQFLKEG